MYKIFERSIVILTSLMCFWVIFACIVIKDDQALGELLNIGVPGILAGAVSLFFLKTLTHDEYKD